MADKYPTGDHAMQWLPFQASLSSQDILYIKMGGGREIQKSIDTRLLATDYVGVWVMSLLELYSLRDVMASHGSQCMDILYLVRHDLEVEKTYSLRYIFLSHQMIKKKIYPLMKTSKRVMGKWKKVSCAKPATNTQQ